jgi:hypothetical protein
MRRHLFLGLVLVLTFGCSSKSYQLTQVSGKVTLDGKPLPKASVTFAPMASQENQAPGPTSHGETDADGRFTLNVDPKTRAAVVGRCRVYITALQANFPADDRDAGGPVKRVKDPVPEKYNKKTELIYDVPAGGTNQANFDLTTR